MPVSTTMWASMLKGNGQEQDERVLPTMPSASFLSFFKDNIPWTLINLVIETMIVNNVWSLLNSHPIILYSKILFYSPKITCHNSVLNNTVISTYPTWVSLSNADGQHLNRESHEMVTNASHPMPHTSIKEENWSGMRPCLKQWSPMPNAGWHNKSIFPSLQGCLRYKRKEFRGKKMQSPVNVNKTKFLMETQFFARTWVVIWEMRVSS